MGNAMKQVMMTYTTRRLFWGLVIVYVGALFFGMERMVDPPRSVMQVTRPVPLEDGSGFTQERVSVALDLHIFDMMAPGMLVFPLMGLAALLGGQLIYQFANPRAKLIPGFVTAHLGVALGMVLVGCVGYTGFVAYCIGVGFEGWWAGMLGVGLLLFGLWVLAITSGRFVFTVGAVAFMWVLTTNRFNELNEVLLTGQWPWVGAGLAVLGAGLCGWVGYRAVVMEEVDRDYQAISSGHLPNENTVAGKQARQALFNQAMNVWWRRKLAAGVDTLCGDEWASARGRVKLMGLGFSQTAFGTGLVFAAIQGVFLVIRSSYSEKGIFDLTRLSGYLMQPSMLLYAGPLVVTFMLIYRAERMRNDCVKPLSRGKMVEGLLKSTAQKVALIWLMQVLVVAGGMASGFLGEVDGRMVWFVLMTGPFVVFGFGLCFWLAASLSKYRMIFVCAPVVLVLHYLLIAGVGNRESVGDVGLMLIAVGCVVLGWLMMRRGVRSWCQVELG